MSLTAGDIVWVPFPYVEDDRRRPRPALLIAADLGIDGRLCWALMITNALREDWPGDLRIADHAAAGLPIPSKVRTAKIAALETATAHRIGRLTMEEFTAVTALLARNLGLYVA